MIVRRVAPAGPNKTYLNRYGDGGCKVKEAPNQIETKLEHQPGYHMKFF